MSAARAATLKRSLAERVHAAGLSNADLPTLLTYKPGQLRRMLRRADEREAANEKREGGFWH